MYQEYQNRLHGKENNGKENTSATTTPVVPPSSILPSTSSTSTTQPPPPPVRPHHPKGHQYAPMKGSSMSMEGATEKEKVGDEKLDENETVFTSFLVKNVQFISLLLKHKQK